MQITTKSALEIEVNCFIYLYDKLFLTDTVASFTENVKFFFKNCLTTERQQYLLHQETFDEMLDEINEYLTIIAGDQNEYSPMTPLTLILFQYLIQLVSTLKQRLESEALVIKHDDSVQFIQDNMLFFSLEIFYIFQAFQSQLNVEGSFFQCSRFICSLQRLNTYIQQLIKVSNVQLMGGKKATTSYANYVTMLLTHVTNITKIMLFRLQKYKDTCKDESLFIIDFYVKVKQALNLQDMNNISHIYNELTIKDLERIKQRTLDYNFTFFDSFIIQLDQNLFRSTLDLVKYFQQHLTNYLFSKETQQTDYIQQNQPSKKIDPKENYSVEAQQISQILAKKSELFKYSKNYKDSENNPFNSPLAIQNPDLMINRHDIAEIEDDGKEHPQIIQNIEVNRTTSCDTGIRQRLEEKYEICQKVNINHLKYSQRGSFEVENYDQRWRDASVQEFEDNKRKDQSFQQVEHQIQLETEQDQRQFKPKLNTQRQYSQLLTLGNVSQETQQRYRSNTKQG